MREEENLSFDIILFVDDSSLINKISLFDLTVCSLSGRGEVGGGNVNFEHSFYGKKSELIIFS